MGSLNLQRGSGHDPKLKNLGFRVHLLLAIFSSLYHHFHHVSTYIPCPSYINYISESLPQALLSANDSYCKELREPSCV